MAHEKFRLAVTLENVTIHWPCVGFEALATGYQLHFLGERRVRVPASLLRAGPLAPPVDAGALTEIYGAVPRVCSFCVQVTGATYRHELARRASDEEATPSPRDWCSLSPRPSPRCDSPGVFSMDGSDSDSSESPGLPTAGRFGLWTVGVLDICADSTDAVDGAPVPIEWSFPTRCTSGATFDERAAKLDARIGDFVVRSQNLRLECKVVGEMRDDHFVLLLVGAFLFVPKAATVASVFAGAYADAQ